MPQLERFESRVLREIIRCSLLYRNVMVDYEYLICADGFHQDYYIISSNMDNYMHLTGVGSHLKAGDFFDACINGTLKESDISFRKKGQTEAAVKGSVRRKIAVLPFLGSIFQASAMAEEGFQKNLVCCSFAVGTTCLTMGFSCSGKARPMTLLKGNALDTNRACPVTLVLRRRKGNEIFDEIVLGDAQTITARSPRVQAMIAPHCRNVE